MHSRVLVTGGYGFIGSNFIRYLLQTDRNVSIVNLDALTYAGNLENLTDIETDPAFAGRYRFIRGDIADPSAVREAIGDGVDAVLNFAAESHVDRSILESGPFIRTNVVGTQVLLDAVRQHKVRRFLHVSTDEVYGSLGSEGFFTENTPLAPNSPYSASKAAADLLVRSYFHTFGIDAVVTRCSNNYGPYQYPEKLIPLFVSKLLRNEPVPVYGDGMNVRDWIHVQDHCRGIDLAWRHGKAGEVYNFGGDAERTNLELVHMLLDSLGKPRSMIRFVRDRPGHDRRYAMDWSKARQEMGWAPQWTLKEGLATTLDWYRRNGAWIQSCLSRLASTSSGSSWPNVKALANSGSRYSA
jgi:dTDP-glucose 4,6-dehydratase